MGSFLDKPKTDKTTKVDSGNGLRAVVTDMQGWRVDMEVGALGTGSTGRLDPPSRAV